MPDPTPRLVQAFLAADSLIKLGPDGYPQYHEHSGLELKHLDDSAEKLTKLLAGRDDLTDHETSVLRLARTDTAWLAAMKRGDRDPALAEARFRARAELVDLQLAVNE